MNQNWLIIPVETKVRELYGKSLLAACAADAGMQVVMGDQRVISQSLHHLPRGVYVDKSVSRTKVGHFQRLRRMGFSIVAWCEEGLTYRDKAAYQFERVSAEAMREVDAIFAWGEVQSGDLQEVSPEVGPKIHVHGNPRFDFLRSSLRHVFDGEVRELSARHGRYILVNTNFSRFNRFEGRDDVVTVLRTRGLITSPEQERYYQDAVEHIGDTFKAFVAAIPQLAAAFPDRTIVVRPHPSENHQRWRREMAGLPNVEVHPEGSAIPWMMGAEAIVHNACTTGIESFLLERPTVAYVPFEHEVFNRLSYLPNAISVVVPNVEALVAALQRAVSGQLFDPELPEKKRFVSTHVANASGELAAQRIVEVIARLHAKTLERRAPWRESGARLLSLLRFEAARVKRLLQPNPALDAYMDQKFTNLTSEEIGTVLDKISKALDHDFALEVRSHPRLRSCFVIRARERLPASPRQLRVAASF